MPLLGAHVSIAGGVSLAPERGTALGCETIQIFSKNQRQWAAKPYSELEVKAFRDNYRKSKLKGVLVHDTYLINLGTQDPAMWTKSRDALVDEVQRCGQLGIPLINIHPGAHMGAGPKNGAQRIGDALRHVLDKTQGLDVTILLEFMAGQGSTMGSTPEEIAMIRAATADDPRVGVCLDTCHLYGAGLDITTPEAYSKTMKALDAGFGLKHVKAFHLNDSAKPLGSKLDRHANIGLGLMETKGFAPLMNDKRWASTLMTLETPEAEEGYPRDLARLRGLYK
jgi:deoxyribonuclease-4